MYTATRNIESGREMVKILSTISLMYLLLLNSWFYLESTSSLFSHALIFVGKPFIAWGILGL